MTAVSFTLLIVDDHSGFRGRARRALELDGFAVIGEAADLAEGLDRCQELQPDVVLLDVHLPDGSGVTAAPRFAATGPRVRVVLTSTYDAADMALAGDGPGVTGFLSKSDLSGAALGALLQADTTN